MDFPWCPDGEVVQLLVVAYPSLYAAVCIPLFSFSLSNENTKRNHRVCLIPSCLLLCAVWLLEKNWDAVNCKKVRASDTPETPVIGDPTLCVNSLQRIQVFHCITWGNCPQLTLEPKGNRRKRPWNIYEMWRIRPVGKHPWSDCRTWSGPTVPRDAWKAAIRPWASVVFLIYISCCWRILLSSGKYCSLPKWIACGWQIAPALHSIWSEAAHALLPVFPHFHPWASIIPCPSCFLSRHWPFRWCLS